jgi:hypothetical protein
MTVAKEPVDEAAHLLDKTITFPDGSSFTRHQPITGLRKDDEEARILCICRKDGDDDTEYVMKIKIQSVIIFSILHSFLSSDQGAGIKF